MNVYLYVACFCENAKLFAELMSYCCYGGKVGQVGAGREGGGTDYKLETPQRRKGGILSALAAEKVINLAASRGLLA